MFEEEPCVPDWWFILLWIIQKIRAIDKIDKKYLETQLAKHNTDTKYEHALKVKMLQVTKVNS